jgi:hypothetical protein
MPNQKSLLEALTEVHLRRLDTADILHRRAVATIAIEATPEEVCRRDRADMHNFCSVHKLQGGQQMAPAWIRLYTVGSSAPMAAQRLG